MYMNMMCKCKVLGYYEKDGKIYYRDSVNESILEDYMFRTREELFDFHSGRKRK